jgi:hypothetical protein
MEGKPASPIWPSSGIAFAVIPLPGYRLWVVSLPINWRKAG